MRSLILLAAAFCAAGQEQTSLSPEQAVEQALLSHPLLASARARIEAAEGLRLQASLRPNPRLYLQSENARLGGTATPFRFAQETDNFAYASQVIEAPGKRDMRTRLAGEVIRRRQADLELLRAQIARRVAVAYWSAVGGEHIREILRQNLANFEQTVEYHRNLVREGAAAEVDLIRIEVEKDQVAVQYQNAEQEARRLRLQLFQEMGKPDQPDVVLAGNLYDVRPFVTDTIEQAMARRRDLQLGRQVVQQARAAERVEHANAKPDPEVLFGYKRTAGYNTVIAGFQIPLPFRNRNQGGIAAAVAETKAAEHELKSAELAAESEILAAQNEYNQKLRLVTETVPKIRSQAEETVRIARAVYREGASDLLRLLDAERTALQAQLLFVRSLTEYHVALVNLKAATGMLP
ncbi:MAG: TolC family protein [Bryobacteraceae bacterium]|nr:TolC family protein [Bryobacteraceae bacterium]